MVLGDYGGQKPFVLWFKRLSSYIIVIVGLNQVCVRGGSWRKSLLREYLTSFKGAQNT